MDEWMDSSDEQSSEEEGKEDDEEKQEKKKKNKKGMDLTQNILLVQLCQEIMCFLFVFIICF